MGDVIPLRASDATERKARDERLALVLDAYDPRDRMRFFRLLRVEAEESAFERALVRRKVGHRA